MSELLEQLKMYGRLPGSLGKLLSTRINLEDARHIIQQRLEQRDSAFLKLLKDHIYPFPHSPYYQLLKLAQCEYGDVQAMVAQQGLEDTLKALHSSGVHITFEEFKGRVPIVRHGQEIAARPEDFANPLSQYHVAGETGGSTGAASASAHSFEYLDALAPNELVTHSAHGILGAPIGLWRGILPDNSSFGLIFRWAKMGRTPEKWFSHMGLRDSKQALKYNLATYYTIALMRLNGINVPWPTFAPLEEAAVVAHWMSDTLKAHGRCVMATQVSRALRICLAAQEAGLDLTGAVFIIAGEPPTPAKVREIHRTGATHFPTYGSESGRLGMGCANPEGENDIHVFKDAFALFSYPQAVPGFDMSVPALAITTLLPSVPRIMLNVAVDDYGILEERQCGCELETLGWTTHLRNIQSYRKLTGEGVTMVGSEMIHILETILPAKFGGSPADYQLMEQEDAQGFTRLSLVVSPRVSLTSEQDAIDEVLNAMGRLSAQGDAARSVWKSKGTLQVKRMDPVWTARGKLMPLHIERLANKPTQKE